MSTAEREKFLAGVHVGIVGIPRAGRGPLTVPIWYDYKPGGKVWMITSPTSLKGRLLQETDRITLCAQNEAPPYSYVSVEGAYSTRSLGSGELLQMAIRYLGDEMGKAYAEGSSEEDNIVVEFIPTSWLTVDYGKS
jgi:hypothetical protein